VQVKQMDMLGKAAADAREDDRKRDQMSIDLWLKASELKAKYPGIQLDATALVQELQRNRELDVIEQRNQVERYQQALNAVGMQQQQAQQAMQAEQAMQPQQPMPPQAPVN